MNCAFPLTLRAAVSTFFWVSLFCLKKETTQFKSDKEDENHFLELQ